MSREEGSVKKPTFGVTKITARVGTLPLVKTDELFKPDSQYLILGVDGSIDSPNTVGSKYEPASPGTDEIVTKVNSVPTQESCELSVDLEHITPFEVVSDKNVDIKRVKRTKVILDHELSVLGGREEPIFSQLSNIPLGSKLSE